MSRVNRRAFLFRAAAVLGATPVLLTAACAAPAAAPTATQAPAATKAPAATQAAAATQAPAVAKYQKLEMRAGTVSFPPDQYYVSLETLANRLKEKTGGEITMALFPRGELGSERDLLESVQLGTLDATCTSTGTMGNWVKDVLAVDFPFLIRDSAHAYKVLDGPIGDGIRQKFVEKNMVPVAWLENGWRQISNSVRPIKSPDDLKGLKIRTMENEVHVAYFRSLGCNPVPIPYGELYNALQQKVVDGQENPLMNIWTAKLYEVQKYITMTEHLYSPALMTFSKKTWDKLPTDIKDWITAMRPELSKLSRDFLAKADADLIRQMKEKGIEFISDVDKKPFIEAANKIQEQFGEKVGKDLVKSIRDTT